MSRSEFADIAQSDERYFGEIAETYWRVVALEWYGYENIKNDLKILSEFIPMILLLQGEVLTRAAASDQVQP